MTFGVSVLYTSQLNLHLPDYCGCSKYYKITKTRRNPEPLHLFLKEKAVPTAERFAADCAELFFLDYVYPPLAAAVVFLLAVLVISRKPFK